MPSDTSRGRSASGADEADLKRLRPVLTEWCEAFGRSIEQVLSVPFTKLVPVSHRPYGKLYAPM